jgi:NADH dehydrogenase
MATVSITGASGFVGSHVLPAVLAEGHRVIALVRTDAAGSATLGRLTPAQRSSVEIRLGDITQAESLPAALRGADAVVHLAAIPRDRNGGADLRRVNTEGTLNVVTAMQQSGVRRLIHLGALGITDDPKLHYASSKVMAEALVQASGLDWTILKPSLQWGMRDGFFNTIAGLVRVSPGIVPVPGRGTSRFQPIAVLDVARIVALCLTRPETVGASFELGGPRYWTYREITAEVLAAIGARRLIMPVPVPLIALVAGVAEALHLPFPVATDQLRQLRLDNVGPLDAVERAFGFRPTEMSGQLGYLRSKPKDQLDAPLARAAP